MKNGVWFQRDRDPGQNRLFHHPLGLRELNLIMSIVLNKGNADNIFTRVVEYCE